MKIKLNVLNWKYAGCIVYMYLYLSIPVSPAKFYGDYSHVSKMTNTISSYNSFKNGMLHRCNSLIQFLHYQTPSFCIHLPSLYQS